MSRVNTGTWNIWWQMGYQNSKIPGTPRSETKEERLDLGRMTLWPLKFNSAAKLLAAPWHPLYLECRDEQETGTVFTGKLSPWNQYISF